MQDAVEKLLSGPQQLKGFYYDSRNGRYFPVPKHGGVSWEHYRDTKTYYETQIKEELAAQEADSAKPSHPNFPSTLHASLMDIRIGRRKNTLYHGRRALYESFFAHSPSFELDIGADTSSRAVKSPIEDDIHWIGSSQHLIKCSIETGEVLENEAHANGAVSGLHVSPSERHLSVSYLGGALQLLNLDTLALAVSLEVPRHSSVWCHEWINSNCLVFGAERGGLVVDVSTGISKGLPMERSSVFSIASVPNSESTFFLGTRSGKLLHVDIRSNSARFHISRSAITHASGVNHIIALNDTNYLISRSMEGNLSLLDLRMQKDVLSWSNPSTSLSFTKSFCLDDTQTFLASAGAQIKIFDISHPTADPILEIEHPPAGNHFIWSRVWTRQKQSGFGALTDEKIEVYPLPI